jgi:hypothetical protein
MTKKPKRNPRTIAPTLSYDDFRAAVDDFLRRGGSSGDLTCAASTAATPHYYPAAMEELTSGFCPECYAELAYGAIEHDAGRPLFGGTRATADDDLGFERAIKLCEECEPAPFPSSPIDRADREG